MILRQLFDCATSSYSYLVANGGEGVLIDPVLEQVERDAKLVKELGIRLTWTIETHVHADHITGAAKLKELFGSRQIAPERGGPSCADVSAREGHTVSVGGLALRCLETPGHTMGCTSWAMDGHVFTGDTLLVRTCGRTDFQGGDPAALWESITTKLFALPDDTVVWPGHDYKGFASTTIGEEKRWNVRVAGRSREAFIDLMNGLVLPMPKKIDEALPANLACGKTS